MTGAKTSTPARWETVPTGTPKAGCTGHRKPGGTCRATIYWIERPRVGKPGVARVPVDCDVEGGSSPDSLSDGKGVSHFTTCVDARLLVLDLMAALKSSLTPLTEGPEPRGKP